MNRNGDAVAKDRQQRAERNGNRAHRPNVDPNGNPKCRRRRGRNRSAESRNYPNGKQKRRRADGEPFDPGRQALQVFVQIEESRRVTINPVTKERREDEAYGVDQRSLQRPEDRAVHDSQRVGHGKRR